MRFVHPELLWLLLALPLLVLVTLVAGRATRRALERFSGGEAHVPRFVGEVSVHRRAIKALLLAFGLAASIVAAARPQWGARLEPVSRRGVDVVVVVDRSLSMAAEDLAPNRLAHALHSIDTLVRGLAGNRVGLVAFAGVPVVLCPLTLDESAVRLFLDIIEPESTQVPGTALAEALRLALRSFGTEEGAAAERARAIVLFTDGEDHEGELEQVARELEAAGVPVYAVGCGTARGAPIPLGAPGESGSGYKKDRAGKVVTTRLDEAVLETLALETRGRYDRATPTEGEIEEIVRALTAMDAHEYGAVLRARYEERYQFPLGLALAALLAEALLGDRVRTRRAEAR